MDARHLLLFTFISDERSKRKFWFLMTDESRKTDIGLQDEACAASFESIAKQWISVP